MKNNKYGISFILFGVICLITALVLSSSTEDTIKKTFPAEGGKFGPIEIQKQNEVIKIRVSQDVANRQWSTIEAEVVDAKNQYLFAFSEGLWFETGRDSEGQWQEGKRNYDIPITFSKRGSYYINFKSENSGSAGVGQIRVEVTKKLGSHLAHLWLGIISLIAGIVISYLFGGLKEWFEQFE